MELKNLRRQFERFCFRNRDKGIPNLMLYIALGNALVSIMCMVNGGSALYELLCFDKTKILQGQVWRLLSYAFTQTGNSLIDLLFLYFSICWVGMWKAVWVLLNLTSTISPASC